MSVSDAIDRAYVKTYGRHVPDNHVETAVTFVGHLFDELPIIGYTDGKTVVEEQWMLEDSYPIWKKP